MLECLSVSPRPTGSRYDLEPCNRPRGLPVLANKIARKRAVRFAYVPGYFLTDVWNDVLGRHLPWPSYSVKPFLDFGKVERSR